MMFSGETKEGTKLKKEKLEQLTIVFQKILKRHFGGNYDDYSIRDITKELLLEVKIRINGK